MPKRSRPPKFITLTEPLCDYVTAHRSQARDALLDALRAETEKLGDISGMLISREQGSFLTLLVAALGVRSAVEVGTFTGYSAICIARGLAPGGRLLCLDINPDWTAIGRRYWEKAGLHRKITLKLDGGKAGIDALPRKPAIDFAFIDADKPGYDTYYELILPRMRKGGVILFDNMLQHGRILKPSDENGRAIDKLNKKLARDARVQAVLLPVADGLTFCRKL